MRLSELDKARLRDARAMDKLQALCALEHDMAMSIPLAGQEAKHKQALRSVRRRIEKLAGGG